MGLLPEIKSAPTSDPCKLTYMIYGPPKIGKTTFCAGLPDVLFLDTEEGTRLQNVYRKDVANWDTFVKVVDEICLGKHSFKNIVVDTTEKLAGFCVNYVCQKANIQHPAEQPFGKAYDLIKKEFEKPIVKLQHSGYGIWFVTHEEVKKIEPAIGAPYDYHQPKLHGFLSNIILSLCDFILYAQMETRSEKLSEGKLQFVEKRIFRTKPSKEWVAGDRLVNSPLPNELSLNTSEFLATLTSSLKKNVESTSNVPG